MLEYSDTWLEGVLGRQVTKRTEMKRAAETEVGGLQQNSRMSFGDAAAPIQAQVVVVDPKT